jgi:hypothetical protein
VVFGRTSTNLPEVAAPKFTDVVVDSAVTVPPDAVTAADVLSSVWAVRVTLTGAERAAEIVTVEAVEVSSILPPVEVNDAPELVRAADPERVMSPVALIAPPGAMDVPPVIRTVPDEAVRAPAPAYPVSGTISTEVPEVAPPMLKFAASEVTVTAPVPADTAADVVTVELAVSETVVEAEIAAEIFTVDALDVTSTLEASDVRVAPELVIAPVPDKVMVPRARIAPVGATPAPPLIRTVPAVAVRAPAPA